MENLNSAFGNKRLASFDTMVVNIEILAVNVKLNQITKGTVELKKFL